MTFPPASSTIRAAGYNVLGDDLVFVFLQQKDYVLTLV
jgi:hypothetical protein